MFFNNKRDELKIPENVVMQFSVDGFTSNGISSSSEFIERLIENNNVATLKFDSVKSFDDFCYQVDVFRRKFNIAKRGN